MIIGVPSPRWNTFRQATIATRRGVALFIVLAALLLVMTMVSGVVMSASAAAARRAFDQDERRAHELRRAIEADDGPIHSWLTNESAGVVLPAQAPIAALRVLHDVMILGEENEIEVVITAFDQQGCARVNAIRIASPLRLAVPEPVRARLDRYFQSNPGPLPTGIDEIALAESSDSDDAPLRAFPPPARLAKIRVLSSPNQHETSTEYGRALEDHGDSYSAESVGAWVSFHSQDVVQVNVNTSPLALLSSALRAAGRGGLELIIEARDEGQRVPLASIRSGALNSPRESRSAGRIELTGSSSCWAFRIDVRVNRVWRSWWTVYRKSSSPPPSGKRSRSPRNDWQCTQRMIILQ